MMGFCISCEHRSASCLRRCWRFALGKHLHAVMRDERLRGGGPVPIHDPEFEALPEDVRQQLIVGAVALHEMPR